MIFIFTCNACFHRNPCIAHQEFVKKPTAPVSCPFNKEKPYWYLVQEMKSNGQPTKVHFMFDPKTGQYKRR